MSMMSIVFLLGAAIMVYIAIQTLQQNDMKIASDGENPENIRKEAIKMDNLAFEKVLTRVDNALGEAKYHDAEQALETALTMRPQDEEVLGKMAYVLEKQGDKAAAVSTYENALKIHANSAALHGAYATLLSNMDNLELAKEHFIESVQIEDNALTFYNFSNLLVKLGEIDAAKDGYNRTLELDPDFKEAREALSSLSMKKLDS